MKPTKNRNHELESIAPCPFNMHEIVECVDKSSAYLTYRRHYKIVGFKTGHVNFVKVMDIENKRELEFHFFWTRFDRIKSRAVDYMSITREIIARQ